MEWALRLFGALAALFFGSWWGAPAGAAGLTALAWLVHRGAGRAECGASGEWGGWLPLRGRWLAFALRALAGLLLAPAAGTLWGAVAGIWFTVGAYRLLDPAAMGDGQWGMIFLWVIPFSGLLGSAVGAALSLRSSGLPRLGGAGCLLAAAGVYAAYAREMFVMQGRWALDGGFDLPGVGAPLAWAALVGAWGAWLLTRGSVPRPTPGPSAGGGDR